jgi:hypothetical protein
MEKTATNHVVLNIINRHVVINFFTLVQTPICIKHKK